MATIIGSILRNVRRLDKEPLNILSFPTHERYQTNLAATGHNFYLWHGPNIKTWNDTYAPLPKNCYRLDGNMGNNQIPLELDLDLVLTQNKFGQFMVAKQLAGKFHLPLVSLEHCLPINETMAKQAYGLQGDINVFITEYSRDCWGYKPDNSTVIHHGVDTQLFSPGEIEKKTVVLSICNDWVNRDLQCGFTLWQQVTGGLPVKVLGDTPGLSKAAKNTDELISAYRESAVFLNTATLSPVPTVLLEAMSCGAACVSTVNPMICDIIKNGENGFLSNDAKELRNHCELLLENKELRSKLGTAARQTIVNKFGLDRFVNDWNNVFNKAKDIVYKG